MNKTIKTEGEVYQVCPFETIQTKAGKEIQKRDFVICEETEKYTDYICITFWGDKAMDTATIRPGDVVEIEAIVSSKNYNGRWFTNLTGQSCTVKQLAKRKEEEAAQSVQSAHVPPAPAVQMLSAEEEPLPF